jgi:hypothetical protein
VTTSPERLQRWLDGFAVRHGPVTRTFDEREVRLVAEDGAVAEVEVPFPPLTGGLVEHVLRDRRVGVLLVRLGGSACGVFDGPRLVASKVTVRQVHGRSAAGGQSQQRFARRREGQVRVALQASADTAVRVLLPHAASLDAVVVGGERTRSTPSWPTGGSRRWCRSSPAGCSTSPTRGRRCSRRRTRACAPSGSAWSTRCERQPVGGSSLPDSSASSASCFVLCTAPSAWSGGP